MLIRCQCPVVTDVCILDHIRGVIFVVECLTHPVVFISWASVIWPECDEAVASLIVLFPHNLHFITFSTNSDCYSP